MSHPLNTVKSITLMELLVSIIIVGIMVLFIYSLASYSSDQVINSERRAKVQNQLAYALEQMSKYVQQANGNISDPANPKPAMELIPNGFRARVDFNNPQTPADLTDDAWVSYVLTGNNLTASCAGIGCPFGSETLSTTVRSGFINGNMPADPLPDSPAAGFYAQITDGSSIYVGLIGHFYPTSPKGLKNPQVALKTRLICNNCSAN